VINVTIIGIGSPTTMEPLNCCRSLEEIPVAGITIATRLERLFNHSAQAKLEIRADFWPSEAIIKEVNTSTENLIVIDKDGSEAIKLSCSNSPEYKKIEQDAKCLNLIYPWDILALNEKIVSQISKNKIAGKVSEAAHIDGILELGEGSIVLPGVYIEGKVVIGKNCKIGPNCYIRGNTYIGDDCHIGQAVEIKNSLLMNKVSSGHLTYLGDSVVCSNTNLGAGTIVANLRHDGKNHKSMVNDELIDTGRRKMGVIIGDNVHTGIHCSIYSGRKIWPDVCTLPGSIIKKDEKVSSA
jgi:bifunctional N-acetylglucosamine-1-phosphate-uridyltransferase/glucosamine-1-phosphate-acetyltransferase GlmU-like protein